MYQGWIAVGPVALQDNTSCTLENKRTSLCLVEVVSFLPKKLDMAFLWICDDNVFTNSIQMLQLLSFICAISAEVDIYCMCVHFFACQMLQASKKLLLILWWCLEQLKLSEENWREVTFYYLFICLQILTLNSRVELERGGCVVQQRRGQPCQTASLAPQRLSQAHYCMTPTREPAQRNRSIMLLLSGLNASGVLKRFTLGWGGHV